ncbi:MAG: glycosyltransferase family 4 protein [Candidatus Aureabacteria bacterium]|nr:glycosyltransferase family 4 protein [Candidatus Auribacterota bacterium]MCK5161461.1 glycosyltransferase family 4 protein [Candidatus Auribacterota bacterium]
MMKICYFGAYNREYARNAVLRKGLQANDVEVVECNLSPQLKSYQRYPLLLRQYLRVFRGCKAVIVAECNQTILPLAYLLAKLTKKPLVFDPFTSLYDTNVFDRRLVKENSLRARYYFWFDKFSMNLADLVLADTNQHLDYFCREFKIKITKLRKVFVGADNDLFFPQPLKRANSRFLVLFWGTYIPLHGIQYIIEAAKILEKESKIRFELVGKGQTWQEMRDLASRIKVDNLIFQDSVPPAVLPSLVAKADLCLGIFGRTKKTEKVIPNKVYQALAAKKPVITADTPAIREIFVDNEHLKLCRRADPESLASAILELKNNQELRERIAENGYRLAIKKFTPQALGRHLKGLLEEII